jgi:2',3'-cyclic-nucleotide 2'-phosphodiesterase (5'-nucleotidase family)
MKSALAWIVFSTALLFGCSTGTDPTAASSTPAPAKESVLRLPPEQLPKDDGSSLAVFFGAELMGSLKDCGCPRNPEGGMVWRVGYSQAFKESIKEVPVLQVDAGYFFGDAANPDGELFPYTVKQNEWLLKAYDEMNIMAANLTYHDLPYAEIVFKKSTYNQRKTSSPFLERIISANVRATGPEYVSPPAFIVHEVAGRQLTGDKKVRVGFFGLTGPGETRTKVSAFKIEDPVVAARRVVPKLRAQADVVVALAYLQNDFRRDLANELAEKVPGIDLIIQANIFMDEREAVAVGRTTIAYARYQTRSLGQAFFYLDDTGRLARTQVRSVRLDRNIPKDPDAEKFVAKADAEVTAAQKEWTQKHQELKPLTPMPWE